MGLKEFNLVLNRDIVACTTDGASVMLKFGRLISPLHQQCLAHRINLSICDVLYKNSFESAHSNEKIEACATADDDDLDEEQEENIVEITQPNIECEFRSNYDTLIKKVRKICRTFRKSPLKNDHLQDFVIDKFNGQRLNLILDVRTRWNSMLHMLEKFLKLKDCIPPALRVIRYEDSVSDTEWNEIKLIVDVLKPLEIVIKELSSEDSSLLKAESSFIFILNQLQGKEDLLSTALTQSLTDRFLSRRQNEVTGLIQYLHNPSFEPSIYFPAVSRKALKTFAVSIKEDFILIGTCTETDSEEAVEDVLDDEGNRYEDPLVQQYYNEFNKLKTVQTRKNSSGLDAEKEFKLFQGTGTRTEKLDRLCSALLTIKPTRVLSERSFSLAGLFLTKIHSQLSDDTLDAQVFLKAYFANCDKS